MKRDLLHTPEGVRDIYGIECRKKRAITDRINKTCNSFGFENIETPSFEYFDVFGKERGTVPSNEMFKCFDHHGNTLVFRPDMTPSIARCAAKYFAEEKIDIKLCYTANLFVNYEDSYSGRLKEFTTVGAELIGGEGEDEDLEIIILAVEIMKAAGIENFEVEIGNVKFFKGLLAETGISPQEEEELIGLINEKNHIAVENFMEDINADPDIKQALLALPGLFGDKESVIGRARELAKTKKAAEALDELEDLYDRLAAFGYEKNVSFDLGTLSDRSYYTGIIFHAYTFGTGEAVLSGGRYDKLISQFGVYMPSVGFSVAIDKILIALNRQGISVDIKNNGTMIVYDSDSSKSAFAEALERRSRGERCNIICTKEGVCDHDYEEYAKDRGYERLIFLMENKKNEVVL